MSEKEKRPVTAMELLISVVFALGIANWGIDLFGISGDMSRAAALIAVAIIIGPTVAAFATKKYF